MTAPARLLIVNGDDYGLTAGVSRGILRAHREGIVTSTSVLAVAPAFAGTVGWLAGAPELGVGAHLAAVGEDPPLLSAAEIPSLVDRRGRLAASWRQFLPRAAAGRVDPSDLAAEFTAQAEAVLDAGVTLTHLDTHQHLHLWPVVRKVVLSMAEGLGVAVRVSRSAARSPVGVVVRRLSATLEADARTRAVPFPHAAAGLDEAGALDRSTLIGAIRRLAAAPGRSAELGSHPGEAVDPERIRYRWDYRWEDELAALTSPLARQAVDDGGFVLGTYADLTNL
ncbi:MAG TPA: ChbG/HpnK family deacetylase [Acidimicrobiales bacterium]|nr:ChbG/HpnK family deacetylase [Acidimicrobiales bacterium]